MGDDLSIVDPRTGEVQPVSQTSIEESRAVAESQAGFLMAKQFPRNQFQSIDRILDSCRRKKLADEAIYSFPRGGQEVTGPSIRLAEVLAQNWGNLLFGIRELEQRDGETVMMAYCYDLESNARAERIFTAKHIRSTKRGNVDLTDPRDIYEHTFNLGARRLRACILQIIPGDVVEEAMEMCIATLADSGDAPTEENIKKMVGAFDKVGVTEEMIQLRQGKKLEALTASEMVKLRRVHKSISDGMSTPEQWFGDETLKQPQEKKKPAAKKKAAPKKKAPAKKKAEPKEEPDPSGDNQTAAPSDGTESTSPTPDEDTEPEDALQTVTDGIDHVAFSKEGKTKKGNAWKLYYIFAKNGARYSCFDAKLVEKAESAADNGYLAEIEFKEGEKGKIVTDLELLG